MDPTLAGAVRQGTAERGGLHLLGGALVIGPGRGAMDNAATHELRCAGGALAGATGALLLVGLLAAAAHLAAGLGVMCALAGGGELRDDHLVDEGDVDLDIEDLRGEVDIALRLAPGNEDLHRSHDDTAFEVVRMSTSPPLGPGIAPLMRSRPRSVSTACTFRPCVV